MELQPIDSEDEKLIEAARDVLRTNYHPLRHTVGAAVRCPSGHIHTGVNIEASAYGPCAEPVALGAAFTQGEREISAIVSVCKRGDEYPILNPCGNCRQMLVDYAPEAMVILNHDDQVVKAQAIDLLPVAYLTEFEDD